VVKSHHVAAIMTMHDLNQALRYADKFVFLRGGRIHAAADRDSVNEAIIEEVYGVRVHMEEVAGRPVVVPMDDTEERLLREHDHAHHHEYGISQ
jgi:iron complex transport system ATP-binding protein